MSKKLISNNSEPMSPLTLVADGTSKSARDSLSQFFPAISPTGKNVQLRTFSDLDSYNANTLAQKKTTNKNYVSLSSLKNKVSPTRLTNTSRSTIGHYINEIASINRDSPDFELLLPVTEIKEIEDCKNELKN